jgi:hypothetical protein
VFMCLHGLSFCNKVHNFIILSSLLPLTQLGWLNSCVCCFCVAMRLSLPVASRNVTETPDADFV